MSTKSSIYNVNQKQREQQKQKQVDMSVVKRYEVIAIMFDFDNTLMNRHVYGMYCNTPDKAKQFMATVDKHNVMSLLSAGTLAMFGKLLSLCMSKGIKVAIGSYGNKDCIKHVCKLLFPNIDDIPIYTPSCFHDPNTGKRLDHGTDMRDNKLSIVSMFAKDYGFHRKHIMLIDDDPNNVQAHVKYHNGVPMPFSTHDFKYQSTGLTVEHFVRIIDCINGSK